ncbi:12395_t:CDS:2 [Ambispora gerdemannii]|uniref:12395_t:CDS:1 n=1 Tax=Ambispora gerdemannii TaxID=144530 RepID=A0A9N8YWG5_9GLOM|nr:12395_t:CDS:2 [Ambispora gerdemannii]
MPPSAIRAINGAGTNQNFKIYDVRQQKTTKFNLACEILKGLTPESPSVMKSIPTMVLYDDRGLQLFDQITYLDEYYLTNCEIDILNRKVDDIIAYIKDGSAIIELGAGSLRKTQLVLESLERNKKDITYYALDLMENELQKSLSSLGSFSNVTLMGLLGTYEEGMEFVSKLAKETPKMILWLGSSLGNFTRDDACQFIDTFRKQAMNIGDLFLMGIDRRNDPKKVTIAYNDPKRVTEEFIMNGLNHVDSILGTPGVPFINRDNFEYLARYNVEKGRHEAYYKSKIDQVLEYVSPNPRTTTKIILEKGELIHIEYSYKYDRLETIELIHNSHMSLIKSWPDSQALYDLHLVQKPPFHFQRHHQTSVPSLEEWHELWKAWDTVTMTMISSDMHFEKPIDLRHPFIFYIGHIPAFLDIILARHFKEEFTEPTNFAVIFERGIDPDVDDPSRCHPHSIVPDKWPAFDSIIKFRDQVRQRLLKVYDDHHKNMSRRLARVLWMTFEHEAMHLETILYMLIQSNNTQPPQGVVPPHWETAEIDAPEARLIEIPGQTITLGHDDNEETDDQDPITLAFGWDNERPPREFNVASYKIQSRPITNKEYLDFLKATDAKADEYPSSWIQITNSSSQLMEYKVRTVFGPVDMSLAKNWPVMLSHEHASKYAEWKGMRLPTEAEMRLFYTIFTHNPDLSSTTGFAFWHPTSVPLDTDTIQTLGSGWEWTSTEFDNYPGFEKSKLYPGYSSDFFDNKHNVILGGSWTTHPRISTRKSFRNWYQRNYLYVFCGFRLCE